MCYGAWSPAMGAACSEVDKSDRGPQRRMSFSSIKRTGKQVGQVLKPGKDYLEVYQVGDSVGSDEGVVSAVNNDNEVEYVSRAIERSDMPIQNMNEVEDHLALLSQLDHIHVCRFIEAYDNSELLNLMYEKAGMPLFEEDPDLRNSKPVTPEQGQSYCRQLAMALSVAHKQGLVHGRLSETSVLASSLELGEDEERSVKICDFGQTFIMRAPRNKSDTNEYEAPDIASGEVPVPTNKAQLTKSFRQYAASDMWALGVLLYRMLTGKVPFPGGKAEDVANFGNEWNSMPDAREVVHGLLKLSGRIRMTADKVLKHPWIVLSKTRVSRSKMMRVLTNVIFNTGESTFKKFAMRVIAEEMSPEKLEVVINAFRMIDRNGDGTLTIEEIRSVLKKYGEEEGAADEIFEAIDRDASGNLNFAEFTAVSLGRHEYCNKEILWHTFNRFDRDGNGMFDQDEILRVAKEVDHLQEGASLEKEVAEIAGEVEMPVDFDTFLQNMVTPAGEAIDKGKITLNKFCYSVCKIDAHGVRHIEPRSYDQQQRFSTNPLLKSPYAAGGGTTMIKSNSRKNSKGSS